MSIARGRVDAALLVAAVVSVLAYLFWINRSNVDDVSPQLSFQRLLTADDIQVTIRRSNESIEIRQRDEEPPTPRYSLVGHPSVPVEPAATDRYFHALASLEIVRTVPAPPSRKQLGLHPPAVEITIQRGRERARLTLGAKTLTAEHGRYAEIVQNGKPNIVVISETSAEPLDIEPSALVEHRLFNWVPSEIRALTVQKGPSGYRIERRPNGRYHLASHANARAKRQSVEKLLTAIASMKLDRESTDHKTTLPVASDDTKVVLEYLFDERTVTQTLHISAMCPTDKNAQTVALQAPNYRSGCVKKDNLPAFPKTAEELFDDSAFFLHADEVEKLTALGHAEPFVLERQGTAYVLTSPRSQAVTLGSGNQLLESLTALKGATIGPCSTELSNSAQVLRLRSGLVGEQGPSDDAIHIGPRLADGTRLICRDDGVAFRVSAADSSILEIDEGLLRDTRLVSVPVEAIFDITIENSSFKQQLVRAKDGHFALVSPQLPIDQAMVESLSERLSQLSVDRWLPRNTETAVGEKTTITFLTARDADSPLDDAGLPKGASLSNSSAPTLARAAHDHPAPSELSRPEKSNRHILSVQWDQHGTPIGRIDPQSSPFVVPASLAALLGDLFVDHSLYRLSEQQRAFTLSRDKDQIHCLRQKESFVCPSQQRQDAPPAALLDALSNLQATHVTYASAFADLHRFRKIFELRTYGTARSADELFAHLVFYRKLEGAHADIVAHDIKRALVAQFDARDLEPLLSFTRSQ